VQGKKQLAPAGSGVTNDLGEYRAFGLRPGRYYVSATYRGNVALPDGEDEYVTTFFPRTPDPSAAVPVDVTPGAQLRNIDVSMRKARAVTIRGKVTSELPPISAGDGSQRMNVMLIPRASVMGSMNTRGSAVTPQGIFEIRSVTPGSYFVSAVAMGGGKTIATRTPVQVGSAPIEGVGTAVAARFGAVAGGTVAFGFCVAAPSA